jgi:hypothetical protein
MKKQEGIDLQTKIYEITEKHMTALFTEINNVKNETLHAIFPSILFGIVTQILFERSPHPIIASAAAIATINEFMKAEADKFTEERTLQSKQEFMKEWESN